jgi:glycosyltransferase involved in cell wall biosynthesis
MDLYIHDYAGHIGQLEVARALAARGHRVVFSYCDELPTPRGELKADRDLPLLTIEAIGIGRPIIKRNYFTRQWQDILYARALVRHLRRHNPQLVVSANNPLIPQWALVRHCRGRRLPVVHWWTDIYALAVRDGVGGKFGPLGKAIAAAYKKLEIRLLNQSQSVLAIIEQFRTIAERWGVRTPLTVIPVAAPTERIQPASKHNAWSIQHNVADTSNVLYCGTLANKHRPELLWSLAEKLAGARDVRLIVVAEGVGADWLRQRQASAQLPNLLLFSSQPFEDYSNVLATADIQLTLFSHAASSYATPSKVLSQLCTARAQVAAVPADSPAALLIEAADAGVVLSSNEEDGLYDAVSRLIVDRPRCEQFGASGRRYAEQHLSMESLVGKYETLFERVIAEYPR